VVDKQGTVRGSAIDEMRNCILYDIFFAMSSNFYRKIFGQESPWFAGRGGGKRQALSYFLFFLQEGIS